MLEPVFVAMNVGITPETKLPLESLKVIVIVEAALLLATDVVPVMVEVELEAGPDVKTTVEGVVAEAPAGVTIVSVLVSA